MRIYLKSGRNKAHLHARSRNCWPVSLSNSNEWFHAKNYPNRWNQTRTGFINGLTVEVWDVLPNVSTVLINSWTLPQFPKRRSDLWHIEIKFSSRILKMKISIFYTDWSNGRSPSRRGVKYFLPSRHVIQKFIFFIDYFLSSGQ